MNTNGKCSVEYFLRNISIDFYKVFKWQNIFNIIFINLNPKYQYKNMEIGVLLSNVAVLKNSIRNRIM